MKDLSTYKITSEETLSQSLIAKGISNLSELSEWLKELPYHRISDNTNLGLTITENCGTCSSKHAFFKFICESNGYQEFDLCIGIYKMSEKNTPGIGSALTISELDYIPEAHCYMSMGNDVLDLTKPNSIYDAVKEDILIEQVVELDQLQTFKPEFHKAYIAKWKTENDIHLSLDDLWKIREACIFNLSKN